VYVTVVSQSHILMRMRIFSAEKGGFCMINLDLLLLQINIIIGTIILAPVLWFVGKVFVIAIIAVILAAIIFAVIALIVIGLGLLVVTLF